MARVAVVGVGAIGAATAAAVQSAGEHELLLCGRRALERGRGRAARRVGGVACPARCSPIPGASTDRPTGCCWPSRPTRRRAPRAGCRRCAGPRRSSPSCRTASTTSSASGPSWATPRCCPWSTGARSSRWRPVACASATPCASRCRPVPAGEGLAALLGDHADVTVGGAFELEAWRKLCANAVSGVMALAGRPAEIFALDDVRDGRPRARARVRRGGARRGRRAHRPRRRRRHRLARGAARRTPAPRSSPTASPAARWSGRRATASSAASAAATACRRRCPTRSPRCCTRRATARSPGRPPRVRTYVRALGQPHDRSPGGHGAARLPRAGGRAPLRRARGVGHPFLRGPSQIRAQPRPRALAHALPLDDQPRTGAAAMPASTASPARPTPTSTSTPAATSRRRSSSRSTCPRCCGSSWRGRRGSASTSRWGRTPTRTSGSRGATSSCAGSGRRCATRRTRARC